MTLNAELLADIEQLTPMPTSLLRLASLVGDADSSMDEITRVISLDQALTANVLRLANSAWSGSEREVVSIHDAVVRLGAARVLALAMGSRLVGPFSPPLDGYDLGEVELWRHSVAAALAAERLGDFTEKRVPGAAFAAALLHDIGKLVLNRRLGAEAVGRIRELMDREGLLYVEAERQVLETDHAQVGAAVARHWRLPEEFVHAIALHHDPDADPTPVLDVVHIANATAKLAGVGLGTEQLHLSASTQASKRVGLAPAKLEALCAIVIDELDKTEKLYGSRSDGA